MKKDDTGSFEFDSYDKQNIELKMLENQASLAIKMEQQIWLEHGLKDWMAVLDVGCGSGTTSMHLADYVRNGSVYGIDPSEVLIQKAVNESRERGYENVRFNIGNVYDLDFPEASFDFIYCRLLFQHLRTPEVAITELKRLLKPGGTICISDIDDTLFFLFPELDSLRCLVERAAKQQQMDGGDRYVGRKLPIYLEMGGLINVKAEVKNISSYDIGLLSFLKMSVDFRTERLPDGEYQKACGELADVYRLVEQQQFAWGSLGLIVSSAQKLID